MFIRSIQRKAPSSESRISILTAKKTNKKKLAFAGQRSFESTCFTVMNEAKGIFLKSIYSFS